MRGIFVAWIFAVVLDVAWAQVGPSFVDSYNAFVRVNIHCSIDPVKGLTCNTGYSDHCKEQWNFPNPCTPANIARNVTKFEHPFDKTKFLMCGDMGKLYVVQCPEKEAYLDRCKQCVGETTSLTTSCEKPLIETKLVANPCTKAAILANKLFFPFPANINKFIHCDVWGKAWERVCAIGEEWSQYDVACVNSSLLNPCARETTDVSFMYKHPCDPVKYLQCDIQGRAFERTCPPRYHFHESNQRCEVVNYNAQRRVNICGNYAFGFTIYSSENIPMDGSQVSGSNADTTLGNMLSAAGTQGTAQVHTSVPNAATGSVLNVLLSKWQENVSGIKGHGAAAFSSDSGHQKSGKHLVQPKTGLDPAQIKEYVSSNVLNAEPCTKKHLAKGWLHYKLKGDPHSFIQCDMSGRMYVMPCSTNKTDWFDIQTMTCVDGPIHVDNQVHK